MKNLLLILLITLSSNYVHSYCDKISLDFLTSSYHYDRDDTLNEEHQGVGITCYKDDYSFSAGKYLNSHYTISKYLSYYHTFSETEYYNVSYGVTVASGYAMIDYAIGDVTAFPSVKVTATYHRVYIAAMVTPIVTGFGAGINF